MQDLVRSFSRSCKNFLVHEKGPAAGSLVTIPQAILTVALNALKYYDDVIFIGRDKSSIVGLPDLFLPIPSN